MSCADLGAAHGLYLHSTVNVVDMPAGATVPAQDTDCGISTQRSDVRPDGDHRNVENEVQNIPDATSTWCRWNTSVQFLPPNT